eukprot:NODE_2360_length_1221_cov_23.578498_g2154_i0.p3 GENE.NODE_2360_length_1221_cov_23.578498_g2154_i0~~NODE_2360_length_1221_cov_23.578498_g2154_i0.p3  ORF type:complete len:133 (+),score=11.96 NODE_2360_length_1221_cov_23.578498_g2154_i0:70-468(+)
MSQSLAQRRSLEVQAFALDTGSKFEEFSCTKANWSPPAQQGGLTRQPLARLQQQPQGPWTGECSDGARTEDRQSGSMQKWVPCFPLTSQGASKPQPQSQSRRPRRRTFFPCGVYRVDRAGLLAVRQQMLTEG